MIAAMSGGEGLGGASSAYFAQQSAGVSGPAASLSGGEGGSGVVTGGEGGITQSSAKISGPGQLLSNLQQLQTQNPAQFTQVVSQIAAQLSAAAQQAQGPQANFLSNLASKFKSVANGGSLAQLEARQQSYEPVQQTYSQGAQGVAGLAQPSSSQAPGNTTLQALFKTISSEVSKALGASAHTATAVIGRSVSAADGRRTLRST